MNIELKLSFDEINYICKLIELTRTVLITMQKKDQIFVFSIVLDIGQKIVKKANSLDESLAIVNRKRYKVKFKYHECVILEKFVLDVLNKEIDPFNANLARSIANQVNQKLA